MKAPVAEKNPVKITQHGQVRSDDYAWIRDDNWRDITAGKVEFANPKVRKYLEEEMAYTEQVMSDTKDLQKELYNELLSHVDETDESYPEKSGHYYYYYRTEEGKNYPIYCRKKGSVDGEEEIYFDVNKAGEGHDLFMVGTQSISPDHKYMAYSVNLSGSLSYSVRVRSLESGEDLNWEIPDMSGDIIWASDSKTIYYGRRHPEIGRNYQIYQVNIDEGPVSKKLIFERPEEHKEKFMSLAKTSSKEYVFIHLSESKTALNYYWKADDLNPTPKLFTAEEKGTLYEVDHCGDEFFVHTNADGSTNFRIDRTPVDKTERANWVKYVPASESKYIESISITSGHLIWKYRDNEKALPCLNVKSIASGEEYQVEMAQEAYDLRYYGANDFDSDYVGFTYESPTQPTQTIHLILDSRERIVRKIKNVPNYDADQYEVRREFATARDGAKIPVTISYKKGLKKNGEAPCYVYAYGSYGFSMPAFFSAARVCLMDRGIVCVTAHIRGGSDKGYGWYLDGKMQKKMNTFNDYIDSCEHLIKERYTSKGKIIAQGGSAGGLLMGAVTNMRPDLFSAVVADVAFVDVINTISDESLPLTAPEWEEWGNPIVDERAFSYIMKYSPYENIEAKDYPNMLYTSGVSDEQVTYWEPTKMVAKLRERKTDDNILLLKMKMSSGHAGASKRYEAYEEIAFTYAFMLKFGVEGYRS